MKAAVKKKWVAALKSGEYKQTLANLRDKKGYCCLGVLCDLYKKETKSGDWRESHNGEYHWFETKGSANAVVLPGAVAIWAGLNSVDPDISGRTLSHINDSGIKFAAVSKIIEKEL